MGNCMETCHQTWRTRDITGVEKQTRFEQDDERRVHNASSGFDGHKGVMRVKIVLTREELEWLMAQLSGSSGASDKGGLINDRRSLEEVLEEIERGRRSLSLSSSSSRTAATWSPSLESIMEIPEVPDHMDR